MTRLGQALAHWRQLCDAWDAFDALSGMEKARRLDAGDPLARFRLGHTHDPRDQGHVVAGYVERYVATICPHVPSVDRYDAEERRRKCSCGWADRKPRR